MTKKNDKLFYPQFLREKLYEKGYKLTPQRKGILQVFIESEQKHLSAEDIYEYLKNKNLDYGLATVYRNVELLTTLGILSSVDFGDGKLRYELNSTDSHAHHHHHLICLKCKKIIEFKEDLLDDLEKQIFFQSGFEIVNHEVKFLGYCHECRKSVK